MYPLIYWLTTFDKLHFVLLHKLDINYSATAFCFHIFLGIPVLYLVHHSDMFLFYYHIDLLMS